MGSILIIVVLIGFLEFMANTTTCDAKLRAKSSNYYLTCLTDDVLVECKNAYNTYCMSTGSLATDSFRNCGGIRCQCMNYRDKYSGVNSIPDMSLLGLQAMLLEGGYESEILEELE
ncbi:hypothetical protein F5B22DRAFT_470676 [Xylaria bambusicola]|uniref:uncharacterized protein n=1 Tax=Xylaria bambusicola TaxID=326684 RepID=UPI002008E208|nr:uncharacterized protein F5B22DRAFT_470676 [Xylaria bambusicola]KAI0522316.1 hypothetical protein F5B22DRAFT_470676 [Xylaria bambusicola]